jgi:hypothetical protein
MAAAGWQREGIARCAFLLNSLSILGADFWVCTVL